MLFEGGVDVTDRVRKVVRSRSELDRAAEEFLAERHDDEATLEVLAGLRRGAIERGIDHAIGRLALAEPQPSGADVFEINQEGRTPNLLIAAFRPADEPLVGLRIVLAVGLHRSRTTDIQGHLLSPFI